MKKTLCITLFIAVFISTVLMMNKAYAAPEAVVNGGFETGDFTGWSRSDPGWIWIDSTYKKSGTYSAWITDGYTLTQSFSPAVTGGNNLFFSIYGFAFGGRTNVTITFSDGYKETVTANDRSVWWNFYVPYAALEAVHGGVSEIKFYPYNHIDTFGIYLDDVSLGTTASKSTATATGTGTAYFTSSDGTMTNLQAVAENTLPTTGKPTGVTFPHGFFSWTVTGLAPGQTITITITFPSNIPAGSQYWKVINGVWTDVTSLVGSNDGDNVITLTITDGGPGDADGAVNGQISDPGGVAIVAVVPPPAPVIESSDSTGTKKDSFLLGEAVYAYGSGYSPSTSYHIHVVNDVATWSDGMTIPAPVSEITVTSDSSGNILPSPVWGPPLTLGKYDIVVDVNGNGKYDVGVDALDDSDIEITAGFQVIPEVPFGTIMTLLSMITALLGFLGIKRFRPKFRLQ